MTSLRTLVPADSIDEVFVCGTASEITPVRSVDRIPVGDGKPGPVDFTHVEKVWFPDAPGGSVTKGDVIQYYLSVADKDGNMVPFLAAEIPSRGNGGLAPGQYRWAKDWLTIASSTGRVAS